MWKQLFIIFIVCLFSSYYLKQHETPNVFCFSTTCKRLLCVQPKSTELDQLRIPKKIRQNLLSTVNSLKTVLLNELHVYYLTNGTKLQFLGK